METIYTLQQAVVASKADQDRNLTEVQAEQAASQNRFQNDLVASRANNEKLRRANEELPRHLQRMGERTTVSELRPYQLGIAPCLFPRQLWTR